MAMTVFVIYNSVQCAGQQHCDAVLWETWHNKVALSKVCNQYCKFAEMDQQRRSRRFWQISGVSHCLSLCIVCLFFQDLWKSDDNLETSHQIEVRQNTWSSRTNDCRKWMLVHRIHVCYPIFEFMKDDQLWSMLDDGWWFMMIDDDPWWWMMIHDDSWLMIDNNDDGDDDDDDDESDGGDDGREITSTSMPRECQQWSSIELSSCL